MCSYICRRINLLLVAVLLVACGGGGGGSASTPPTTSPGTPTVIAPTIEISPIADTLASSTPTITIEASEEGVLTFNGCYSTTATISEGMNRGIPLRSNSSNDGFDYGMTHNCQITLTAPAPARPVSTMVRFSVPAALTVERPTALNSPNPTVMLTASVPANLTYSGDCESSTTTVTRSFSDSITLKPANNTGYSNNTTVNNCAITLTDANSASQLINVPSFTIAIPTSAPAVTEAFTNALLPGDRVEHLDQVVSTLLIGPNNPAIVYSAIRVDQPSTLSFPSQSSCHSDRDNGITLTSTAEQVLRLQYRGRSTWPTGVTNNCIIRVTSNVNNLHTDYTIGGNGGINISVVTDFIMETLNDETASRPSILVQPQVAGTLSSTCFFNTTGDSWSQSIALNPTVSRAVNLRVARTSGGVGFNYGESHSCTFNFVRTGTSQPSTTITQRFTVRTTILMIPPITNLDTGNPILTLGPSSTPVSLRYSGNCTADASSITTAARTAISLRPTVGASYATGTAVNDCTIALTDASGASQTIAVPSFTVDIDTSTPFTAPTLGTVASVLTQEGLYRATVPVDQSSADYTGAVSISYGGDCRSSTTALTRSITSLALTTAANDDFSGNINAYTCAVTFTDASGTTSTRTLSFVTEPLTLQGRLAAAIAKDDTTVSVALTSSEAGTLSVASGSDCSFVGGTTTAVTADTSATVRVQGVLQGVSTPLTDGVYTNCNIRVTHISGATANYRVGGATGFTIDLTPTLTVSDIASALASTTPSVTVTASQTGTLTYSGCYSATTSVSAGTATTVALRADSESNGFDYGTDHSCAITFTAATDSEQADVVTKTFTIPSALTVATASALHTGNPTIATTSAVAGDLTYAGNCDSTTDTVTASFSGNIALKPSDSASYAHDATVANCVVTLTHANGASQSVAIDSFTVNIPFVAPTFGTVASTLRSDNLFDVSVPVDQSAADYTGATSIRYAGDCTSETTALTSEVTSLALTTTADANFAGRATDYSCTATFTSVDGRTVARTLTWNIAVFALQGELASIEKDDTTVDVTLTTPYAGTLSVTSASGCRFESETVTTIAAGTAALVTLEHTTGDFSEGTYTDCNIRVTHASGATADYQVGDSDGFAIDLTPTLTVSDIASALASTTPSVTVTANQTGTLTYSGCYSATTSVSASTATTVALRADSESNGFDYGTDHSCAITFTAATDSEQADVVTKTFTIPSALTVATASALHTGNPTIATTSAVAGDLTYAGNCDSTTDTVTASFSGNIALKPSASASYAHDATVANCVVTLTHANGASQSVAIDSFTVNIPFVAPTFGTVASTLRSDNLFDVSVPVDQSAADYTGATSIRYAGDCTAATTALTSTVSTLALMTTARANFTGRTTDYSCTVTFTSVDGRTVARTLTWNIAPFALRGQVATIAKDDTTVDVTLTIPYAGTLSAIAGRDCKFVNGTTTAIAANTATTVTLEAASSTFTDGTYTNCIVRATTAIGAIADYQVGGATGFTIDLTPTLAVSDIAYAVTNATPSVLITASQAGSLAYSGCYSATTSITAGTATTVALRADSDNTGFDYAETHSCAITFTADSDSEQVSSTETFTLPAALRLAPVSALNTGNPRVVTSTAVSGSLTYAGDCDSATDTITANFAGSIALKPSASASASYAHDTTVANCVVTLTHASGASQAVAIASFTINIPFVVPTFGAVVSLLHSDGLFRVSVPVDQSSADYTGATSIAYSGDCRSTTTALTSSISSLAFTTTADTHFSSRTADYSCTATFTSVDGRTVARRLTWNIAAFALQGEVATIAKDATTVSVALTTPYAGTLSVTSGSGCRFDSETTTAIAASIAKTVTLEGDPNTFEDGTYTNCIVRVTTARGAATDYRVGGATGFTIDITPTLTVADISDAVASVAPHVNVLASQTGTLTYSGCYSSTTSVTADTEVNIAVRANNQNDGFNYAETHSCTITLTAASDSEQVNVTDTFTIPSVLTVSAPRRFTGGLPVVDIEIADGFQTVTTSGNCRFNGLNYFRRGISPSQALTLYPSNTRGEVGYSDDVTVSDCVITSTHATHRVSESVALDSFTIDLVPWVLPVVAFNVEPTPANQVVAYISLDQSAANYQNTRLVGFDSCPVNTPLTSDLTRVELGTFDVSTSGITTSCGVSFQSADGRFYLQRYYFAPTPFTLTGTLSDIDHDDTTVSVSVETPYSGTLSAVAGGDCSLASGSTTPLTANTAKTVVLQAASDSGAFTEGTYTACNLRVTHANGTTTDYRVGGSDGFAIDLTPTLTVSEIPDAVASATPSVTVTASQAGALTYSGCYSATTSVSAGTATTVALRADSDSNGFDYGTDHSCVITLTATSDSETASVTEAFTIPSALTVATATGLHTGNPTVATTSAVAGDLTYAGNCDSTTDTVTASFSGNIALKPSDSASYAHDATVANCVVTLTHANGASQSVAIDSFTVNIPFVAPTFGTVASTLRSDNLFDVSVPVDQSAADYTGATSIRYAGDCTSETTALTSEVTSLALTTTADANFAGRATDYSCTATFTSVDGRTVARTLTWNIAVFALQGELASIEKDDTTVDVTLTTPYAGTLSVTSGSGCRFDSETTTAISANTAKTVTIRAASGTFTEGTYTDCTIRATASSGPTADYRVGGATGFTINLNPTLTVSDIASALASTVPSVSITASQAGALTYSGCDSTTTSVDAGTTSDVTLLADNENPDLTAFFYGETHSCTITLTATSDSDVVSVTETFTIPSVLTVGSVNATLPQPTVTLSSSIAGGIDTLGNCLTLEEVTVPAGFSGNIVLIPDSETLDFYEKGTTVSDCSIVFFDENDAVQLVAIPSFTIDTTAFIPPILGEVSATATADDQYNLSVALDHSRADFTGSVSIEYGGECQSSTTALTSSVTSLALTTTSDTAFAMSNTEYPCTITFTSSDGRSRTQPLPLNVNFLAVTESVVAETTDGSVHVTLTSSHAVQVTQVQGSSCIPRTVAPTLTANTATTIIFDADSTTYTEGTTYTNCQITLLHASGTSLFHQVGGESGFTINITPTLSISDIPNSIASVTPSVTAQANQAGTLTYSGCYSTTTEISAATDTTIALRANSDSDIFDYGDDYSCVITFTASGDSEEASVTETFTVPDGFTVTAPATVTAADGVATVPVTAVGAGALSYSGNCKSTTASVTAGFAGNITLTPSTTVNYYTDGTVVNDCMVTWTPTNTHSQTMAANFTVTVPFEPPTLGAVVKTTFPSNQFSLTVPLNYASASNVAGHLVSVSYNGDCRAAPTTLWSGEDVQRNELSLLTATGSPYFAGRDNAYSCMVTFTNFDGRTATRALSIAVHSDDFFLLNPRTVLADTSAQLHLISPVAATLNSSDCSLTTTSGTLSLTANTETQVTVQDLVGGSATAFTQGWHSCTLTATATADSSMTEELTASFYIDTAPTLAVAEAAAPASVTGTFNLGSVRTFAVTVNEDVALTYSSPCTGPTSVGEGTTNIQVNVGTAARPSCMITATDTSGGTVTAALPASTSDAIAAATVTLLDFGPVLKADDPSAADMSVWNVRTALSNTVTGGAYDFRSTCNINRTSAFEAASTFSDYGVQVTGSTSGTTGFTEGIHSCQFWYVQSATGNPASNVITISFEVVANEKAGALAGYRARCSADRMGLGQIWDGQDRCDEFIAAEAALPTAARLIPGYAQFHYDTERDVGAITQSNSRLSIIDNFGDGSCNWSGDDWLTCSTDSSVVRHGNYVEATSAGVFGVPTSRTCNTASQTPLDTLLNECVEHSQIVNVSIAWSVDTHDNNGSLTLALANRKDVFVVLPTGNCDEVRCALGDAFELEPIQHPGTYDADNLASIPQDGTSALSQFLEAGRGMLVTGYVGWYDEDQRRTDTNLLPGSRISHAEVGIALPCGAEWRHCVTAPFSVDIGSAGVEGTEPLTYANLAAQVHGTSFSAPSVASMLAVMLHRWPGLWTPEQAPEKLANIVYNCASYDYRLVASPSATIWGGGDYFVETYDTLSGSGYPVHDFADGTLTLNNTRRLLGRGIVDFRCLFEADGTLVATPPTHDPDGSSATNEEFAFIEHQYQQSMASIEEAVDETTTVDAYNQAVAQVEQQRNSALEQVARASNNFVPTTTGQLHLEGVDGIEKLIGYDNLGRDFDRTPAVTSSFQCQDFYGQVEDLTFALCDNTVRMNHRINGYLNIGWFLSNSSFNGSFGTEDLRFGDSIGLKVQFSKSYLLGKSLSIRISTELNAGYMFNTDKHSYLSSYQAYSMDVDLGINYRGFNLSISHESGSHGALGILNHELGLKPRDDTSWSMRYTTKI